MNRRNRVAGGAALKAAQAADLRRALRTAGAFREHIERELSPAAPASSIPPFAPATPLPEWPTSRGHAGVVSECLERTRKWIDAFNDPRTGPRSTLSEATNGTATKLREAWMELGRGVFADLRDASERWARSEGAPLEEQTLTRSA